MHRAPRLVLATPLLALLLVLAHFGDVAPDDWALSLATPRWYQPATYLFAHGSATHVLTNAAALVAGGALVERLHGGGRVLVLFAYTGVAAALAYGCYRASQFSDLGLRGRVVGASGAVYGLVGAHGAHLALNWHETPLRAPWLLSLGALLVLEAALYAVAPQPGVAYTAHVAGAVHGALIGLVVLDNPVVRAWEVPMQRIAPLISLSIALGSGLGFCLA